MSIAARCNCRLIAPGAFSCRCGPGGFSFPACFRRCEVRNVEGGCGIAGLPAARFGAELNAVIEHHSEDGKDPGERELPDNDDPELKA